MLSSHDKNIVFPSRHLRFYDGIVNDVVSEQPVADVVLGDVHRVVVVPEVARKLAVFVAVYFYVGLVHVGDGQESSRVIVFE